MGLDYRRLEPDVADEINHPRHLDRPEPETVPVEMPPDAFNQGVALFAAERPEQALVNLRVGVEGGEGFPVRVLPGAQPQPGGGNRGMLTYHNLPRPVVNVSSGLHERRFDRLGLPHHQT